MICDAMKQWADGIKTDRPLLIDAEVNNICYISMKYLCGWQMRQCDLVVVIMLAGEIKSLADLRTRYVEHLADHIWDHLMGEPDEPSADDLAHGINAIITEFYKLARL